MSDPARERIERLEEAQAFAEREAERTRDALDEVLKQMAAMERRLAALERRIDAVEAGPASDESAEPGDP